MRNYNERHVCGFCMSLVFDNKDNKGEANYKLVAFVIVAISRV